MERLSELKERKKEDEGETGWQEVERKEERGNSKKLR